MKFFKKINAFLRKYEGISNFWQVAFARFYRRKGMVAVRLRNHPIQMKMRIDSYSMFAETWLNLDYDIKYFDIRKGDIVLDIGANQGFYSCYAANLGARVYAFEPVESTIRILKENLQLNGFENSIVPVQMAVGSGNEPVSLFEVNNLGGGMNTVQPGFANYARSIGLEVQEMGAVQSISIAEIVQKYDIAHIRMCKVDCEGSELEILKSFPEWLIKETDAFIVEFHPNYELNELTRLMMSWGTHQISFADDLPHCKRTLLRAVANHFFV